MEAVFLDRDGVINENRPDHVKSWAELELLPGAVEAIARLAQAGVPVFVITNQAIVNRGLVSREIVEEIQVPLSEPITAGHIDEARERVIRARATHLDSLLARLEEDRVRRVLEPLLAGEIRSAFAMTEPRSEVGWARRSFRRSPCTASQSAPKPNALTACLGQFDGQQFQFGNVCPFFCLRGAQGQ